MQAQFNAICLGDLNGFDLPLKWKKEVGVLGLCFSSGDAKKQDISKCPSRFFSDCGRVAVLTHRAGRVAGFTFARVVN